jgi:hypothetical protein
VRAVTRKITFEVVVTLVERDVGAIDEAIFDVRRGISE